jgi:hypothetical protein
MSWETPRVAGAIWGASLIIGNFKEVSMKTKRFFLFGLPAVLLALGLVLAGCDNGSTDSGGGSGLTAMSGEHSGYKIKIKCNANFTERLGGGGTRDGWTVKKNGVSQDIERVSAASGSSDLNIYIWRNMTFFHQVIRLQFHMMELPNLLPGN